jgi:hypothetical protein
MLTWEHSGFSVDASVRITLLPPQVRVCRRSLEHLLRYCGRPPFALERLSVRRGADGRIAQVRYVLPRHKATDWGELVQAHDDREAFQVSPDELPVIDIHSL